MNQGEIESQRIAGEMSLILENGSVTQKASLLRLLRQLKTSEEYETIRDSYDLTDAGTSKYPTTQ